MRIQSKISLLLVLLFLLVAGAVADTIQVQNVQINSIGETIPVEIILDTATNGFAGYDISISLSDPSVASITEVTFPSWALLNESSPLPASSVRMRMVDLDNQTIPGSTDVSFGSITLQGDAIGSTDVEITIKEITSDSGESLSPSLDSGRLIVGAARTVPIIANHTTIDLSKIPRSAINTSKDNLHIAYGHTSHGSQIVDGMSGLVDFANAPYGGSTYAWNNGGTGDALDFRDDMGNYGNPNYGGAEDLGQPNLTAWPGSTRLYLQAHPEVNVIMWSWCGQVSGLSDAQLNYYLSSMNTLESEYPNVNFVYMTGHLDGSGESGTLNANNEKIRAYVRANNKILFDFADIESYDPDGFVNYMKLMANDNCDYDSNGDGSRDKNWATIWQTAHPDDWYNCGAAHSQPLNANQKAYAAWWLWARLGGWDGTPVTSAPVAAFTGDPTSGSAPLTVQFTDLSTGDDITAWAWDFNNDGNIDSTEQNPEYIYTDAGTYSISLEVTNTEGSDSATQMYYITVLSSETLPDKIGLYRPSTSMWYLDYDNSGASDERVRWGLSGDLPVAGDWDGDGKDEIGLYRPSSFMWYLDYDNSGASDERVRWGLSGDLPVTGSWS